MIGLAKKTYSGSMFVGRILVSMTISRDEKPEYVIEHCAAYREPLT
jgi:hypothetical protein